MSGQGANDKSERDVPQWPWHGLIMLTTGISTFQWLMR